MQEQIGRYEIRRELGRGGMATVYLAYDPRFKRQVAVKVLPRQFTHDPKYLARFEQEAQVIATLEHPSIVPVYDFGEYNDAPFLVMRFMAGGSLHDRLSSEPLSLEETAALLERLAPALDKAHNAGIIHRDIKPSNILFDEDGNPYLADFGIARLAEASQTMTVVGTPAYMSPEQVEGALTPDGRADIYALGVMLYELLTGRQPYEAETPTKQMMAHVLQPVPDILAANPNLPPDTQTIINKTMAKYRDDRYASTGELAEALSELLELDVPTGEGRAADAAVAAAAVKRPEDTADVAAAPAMAEPPVDDGGAGRIEEAVPPEQQELPAGEEQTAVPLAAAEGSGGSGAAPPANNGRGGRGLPGWIWWIGALALLLIAVFSLRAIFGRGGESTDSADVVEMVVTGTVIEAEEAAPAAEEETAVPTATATEPVGETKVSATATVEVLPTVTETESVTEVVEVTDTPEPISSEPVTLRWNWQVEPPTLDPALATDTASVDVITNLFMGLTSTDPTSGEVQPGLASSWSISEDGKVYNFYLRDDVPWVNYDPNTETWTIVTDEKGSKRYVNANDFVYGIRRTADPETGSDYVYVLYNIAGVEEFNSGEAGFTAENIGVTAVDDYTLQITLDNPAAYFPAIAGLWPLFPQPQWAIEAWGEAWTEAGSINTIGFYGLEEWVHGGSLNLVKNPLHPEANSVQIERIEGVMIVEESTAFAMYENNELDTQNLPLPDIDRVKADPVLSKQLVNAPFPCTYYYGFTNNKAPFDDVRVRQAFSQAIDRQSLIDNVTKGGQTPATSFAPPGIFGAPPPGEVGLGYDPEAAQSSLQAYLDEQGISVEDFSAQGITLMHNTSEAHAAMAAAIQQMWKDVLGVDVQVENQEWKVYLQTINKDTPLAEMPHIFRLGWCADYADENNWVHESFNAEASGNRLRRNCSDPTCSSVSATEFDRLTEQAAYETDQALRIELYTRAEEILAEEEVAYAPIYHYTTLEMVKPWLSRKFSAVGGEQFYTWSIDQAAQLEALGR